MQCVMEMLINPVVISFFLSHAKVILTNAIQRGSKEPLTNQANYSIIKEQTQLRKQPAGIEGGGPTTEETSVFTGF